MTAALKRRSRRNPKPADDHNPPDISQRDIRVFTLLTRYKYLDSRQLWQLLTADRGTPPGQKISSAETDFKKRLRRLTDWGFIHRTLDEELTNQVIFLGNEVYEIWDEGILFLATLGIEDENLTGLLIGSHAKNLAHAMMVCAAVASIEFGCMTTPGLRFIPPSEILGPTPHRFSKDPSHFPKVEISYDFPNGRKSTELRQRPDSPVFAIGYNTGGAELMRPLVVEAERKNRIWCGDLEQSSYLRKALAYQKYAYDPKITDYYKIPSLQVLTLAPTITHCKYMAELVMDITNNKGSTMHLYAQVPAFGHRYRMPPLMPDLIHHPYDTAGRGKFYISTHDGKAPNVLAIEVNTTRYAGGIHFVPSLCSNYEYA